MQLAMGDGDAPAELRSFEEVQRKELEALEAKKLEEEKDRDVARRMQQQVRILPLVWSMVAYFELILAWPFAA